mmetsp:Transcript_18739/g.38394  ORF Transcript_18739/g.38394 Transcript_18739/m.38394 type:complete len:133 (+) Transcript_18739:244-642(+)
MTSTPSPPPSEPLTQEAVLQKYKNLESACRQFVTKISELEVERNEHELVIKTLTPLPAARKAHRLVGGVLVERDVGTCLPQVTENKRNIEAVITNLNQMLEERTKELREWKAMHNIKTQEEARREEEAIRNA